MSRYNSFDNNQSMWIDRQVEAVQARLYEYEYGQYRARELLPTEIDEKPYAKTITYYIYNRIGMFKIISNSGRDLPRIDLYANEVKTDVKTLGASYGWTTADVRAAVHNNVDLDVRKGLIAKETYLATENRIAWRGAPEANIFGLVEHPNAIRVTLPADGEHAGTSLRSKIANPEHMIRDLTTIANASAEVTDGVERANTLLLPMREYNAIANTRYTETKTVLAFFKENNPNLTLIDWIPDLRGASTNGNDVILCYNRDPLKLELVVPMDFTQHPAQEIGLEVVVPCEATCAGVILYKPLSVAYCEVTRPAAEDGPPRSRRNEEDSSSKKK